MNRATDSTNTFSSQNLTQNGDAVLALLLSAVDPEIGGVLLVGFDEKTSEDVVKQFTALLPPLTKAGCCHRGLYGSPAGERFNSGARHFFIKSRPLVILPTDLKTELLSDDYDGSDQPRMCPNFCPNLLAAADQGVLFIPNINRREEGLREKIFNNFRHRHEQVYWHKKTMWPRPFLLVASTDSMTHDLTQREIAYFGLYVKGKEYRLENPQQRNNLYDFAKQISSAENPYEIVPSAQKLLSAVRIPSHIQERIATIAGANEKKLHQSQVALNKATCAIAALRGSKLVEDEDLDWAAKVVLPVILSSNVFSPIIENAVN
jgi:Mg-chelatase subunit ChlI